MDIQIMSEYDDQLGCWCLLKYGRTAGGPLRIFIFWKMASTGSAGFYSSTLSLSKCEFTGPNYSIGLPSLSRTMGSS